MEIDMLTNPSADKGPFVWSKINILKINDCPTSYGCIYISLTSVIGCAAVLCSAKTSMNLKVVSNYKGQCIVRATVYC